MIAYLLFIIIGKLVSLPYIIVINVSILWYYRRLIAYKAEYVYTSPAWQLQTVTTPTQILEMISKSLFQDIGSVPGQKSSFWFVK